ncbi:MAG: hypothetical protein ACYT04_13850 [Nostoc sp.]
MAKASYSYTKFYHNFLHKIIAYLTQDAIIILFLHKNTAEIAPQRLTVCVATGASTHATAFMPRRGNTLKITWSDRGNFVYRVVICLVISAHLYFGTT